MPIGARIELDLRDVDKGISQAVRAGKNLKPVWNKLGPVLRKDLEEHQRRQEGPDGAWDKLSPETRGRGGRPKRRIFSKKFAKAVSLVSNRTNLFAIHKVSWAIAHQLGEVVGRGVKLPARILFWLSDEFAELAVDEIGKHIAKGWRR